MNCSNNIMPLPDNMDSVAPDATEAAYERDYSQMDLVDLIDQPAWKTILIDLVSSEKWILGILMLLTWLKNI